MCQVQVVGDYYTLCGHFHARHENGIKIDCGWEACANSTRHMHTEPNCGCISIRYEDRKIVNTFRKVYPGGTHPITTKQERPCKPNSWSEFH